MPLSQVIECSRIKFVKDPELNKLRSFNKDFATKLAAAIKDEGQRDPIGVRPDPDHEGHYLGIYGEHRYFAISGVNREQSIIANVFDDFDDDDARMAATSENLWRMELTQAQRFAAIKVWYDHYQKKHPEAKRAAAASAKRWPKPDRSDGAAGADSESAADEDEAGIGQNSEEVPPKTPQFAEVLAATAGQSVRTARMDTRIANAFTDKQFDVLERCGVGKVDMESIAKIKDQVHRGQVVTFIDCGMDVAEAIRNVVDHPSDPNEVVVDEGTLSDPKWLETYCSEIRGLLAKNPENLAIFDTDAVMYRKFRDYREDLDIRRRREKKKLDDLAKLNARRGQFARMLNKILNAAHPKDWLVCSCGGSGKKENARCTECWGDGYKMQVDTYRG